MDMEEFIVSDMNARQFIVYKLMEILGYKERGEHYFKEAYDLIKNSKIYIRKNGKDERLVYMVGRLMTEYRRIEEALRDPVPEFEGDDLTTMYKRSLQLYKDIVELYNHAKKFHDDLIAGKKPSLFLA